MAIEFRGWLVLTLFVSVLAQHKTEQYGDLVKQMSSSIRSSLVILAHTAQEAHPKLGLAQPLDPLPAQGPLRYTNDGDLLKLRLLLSNVTLTGLSSLNLQEISFDGYPKMDGFTGLDKTKQDVIVTTENSFIYEDEPSSNTRLTPSEKFGDYDYKDKSYDNYYYYDVNQRQNMQEDDFDGGGFHEYRDAADLTSDRKVAHTRYERSISDRRLRHSLHHYHKIHEPIVFQIKGSSKHNARHHHKRRRGKKSTRSAPESTTPERLSSSVRVALKNLRVVAQYVIRGSAGGVFTFKEQGKLKLTIPNVFLTSRFNMTVTPEEPGMRHWSSRKYHVKVQKVETRMTLESPKLELLPDSRSPEWIRRQVQEKMDELGAGVGRRDGAIRLLLRHWAKLLRRLVLKASKNYQSLNDK